MEGRAGFYQGPDYSWTLTYSDADTCPNALFIGLPLKYSLPPVPLSVSLSLCLTQLLLPCTFLNSRERASHGRSDFNQESALAGDGLAGGQRKPPEWQGHDEKRCLRCHLLHGLRKQVPLYSPFSQPFSCSISGFFFLPEAFDSFLNFFCLVLFVENEKVKEKLKQNYLLLPIFIF